MIYLPRHELLIVTPPKCATHSLHTALCCDRWGGVTYFGPSLGALDRFDRHTSTIPIEAAHCRRVGVVRNPWARLVSLHSQHCSYQQLQRQPLLSFEDYVAAITQPKYGDRFFAWNLHRFYRSPGSLTYIRVESLAADLAALGLAGLQLPHELGHVRSQPIAAYFDPATFTRRVTFAAAETWCAPDADRWGYSPPG